MRPQILSDARESEVEWNGYAHEEAFDEVDPVYHVDADSEIDIVDIANSAQRDQVYGHVFLEARLNTWLEVASDDMLVGHAVGSGKDDMSVEVYT